MSQIAMSDDALKLLDDLRHQMVADQERTTESIRHVRSVTHCPLEGEEETQIVRALGILMQHAYSCAGAAISVAISASAARTDPNKVLKAIDVLQPTAQAFAKLCVEFAPDEVSMRMESYKP